MPERLFLFIQLEFPWALGPPDGRYLLRARGALSPDQLTGPSATGDAEPERVIVLGTLGAKRRAELGLRRASPRRARPRDATPEPAPVTTARVTIVDPVSLSAERQAQAWLSGIDAERETHAAFDVLNRVLFAHRIASADPHTHEVSPAQALVIRAGWGEGEQVADGRWLHARELPWTPSSRSRRRVSALRPQERLAELLGARDEEMLCEELALRARLDLNRGRLAHAAIELDSALAAALGELGGDSHPDLAVRVDELRTLRPGVTRVARMALPGGAEGEATALADAADASEGVPRPGVHSEDPSDTSPPADAADAPTASDEEVLRHALERLEAALRARTAAGFTRS
jgi:hypothetical protein